jgi:hypothetical protein
MGKVREPEGNPRESEGDAEKPEGNLRESEGNAEEPEGNHYELKRQARPPSPDDPSPDYEQRALKGLEAGFTLYNKNRPAWRRTGLLPSIYTTGGDPPGTPS